jgi:small conductance mechanosensitive channel
MVNILHFLLGVQTVFAQTSAGGRESESPLDILGFLLEKLPLWLTAVVVFGLSLVAGAMVKNMVENRLASKIEEEHQEVLIISGRVAFVIVAVIGTTIALAIAGINITTLLAAVGFGISFGLQDTISNFVAGLGILASRPFTIGDWIKINGNTGKVVEIRTRATYLKTFDGLRLIVPNSELYKTQVLSYTSNPMRRLKVPVYCRYGMNIQDVIAICLKEVKKNPKIFLEPKPHVVITDLADSYIALETRFWVDSKSLWRRIQSEIFMNIQSRLEEAGLDAPYAVTSLSFENDIESAVLKTKSLDPNEFSELIKTRMAEESAISKKRQELVTQENFVIPHYDNVDQSGKSFLQTTEAEPNPTVVPEIQPVANTTNTPT